MQAQPKCSHRIQRCSPPGANGNLPRPRPDEFPKAPREPFFFSGGGTLQQQVLNVPRVMTFLSNYSNILDSQRKPAITVRSVIFFWSANRNNYTRCVGSDHSRSCPHFSTPCQDSQCVMCPQINCSKINWPGPKMIVGQRAILGRVISTLTMCDVS